MQQGSRKGFKFVKTSKPTTTESLTFEQLSQQLSPANKNSSSTSSSNSAKSKQSKKRNSDVGDSRPDKRMSTSSSNKTVNTKKNDVIVSTPKGPKVLRKSKASHSNKSQQPVRKKSHYPRIAFDTNEAMSSIDSSMSHSSILIELVKTVCENEMTGLEEYFSTDDGNSSSSQSTKPLIKDSLQNVLSSIPTALENTINQGVEFTPELSREEKHHIRELEEVKEKLLKDLETLSSYENNIESFGEKFNLWAIGREAPVEVASNTEKIVSSHVEKRNLVVEKYKTLLTTISGHCDRMLKETSDAKQVIADSLQVQTFLYDTFSKLQQDNKNASGDSKVPQDSRDLLRALPSLY